MLICTYLLQYLGQLFFLIKKQYRALLLVYVLDPYIPTNSEELGIGDKV